MKVKIMSGDNVVTQRYESDYIMPPNAQRKPKMGPHGISVKIRQGDNTVMSTDSDHEDTKPMAENTTILTLDSIDPAEESTEDGVVMRGSTVPYMYHVDEDGNTVEHKEGKLYLNGERCKDTEEEPKEEEETVIEVPPERPEKLPLPPEPEQADTPRTSSARRHG